ncbi:MAG: NADH-quinone oxidoreductase subunit NuoE [Nitrospirae bacterium]|nr:NADH-quinone oxidoreductase subunit NuoE [Nitrospirota bacterium]
MLTENEREELEKELGRHELKSSASVEALKIVQRYRGWISDESLRDTAVLLEMTPEELDSVATFYSMIFRRRVGRHVILVCTTISCWVVGYEGLLNYLHARLGIKPGETTADDRFTLLPIPCLGACDGAPAIMVDETLYTNVTEKSISEIIEKYE